MSDQAEDEPKVAANPDMDWCTCGHMRLLHGYVAGVREGKCSYLSACPCKKFQPIADAEPDRELQAAAVTVLTQIAQAVGDPVVMAHINWGHSESYMRGYNEGYNDGYNDGFGGNRRRIVRGQ